MPRLIVDDATLSDDGKWGAASTLNIPLEGSRHMIQIDKVGGCGKGIHEDRTWRFGYVTIVNGYGSFQENKNVEINHEHQARHGSRSEYLIERWKATMKPQAMDNNGLAVADIEIHPNIIYIVHPLCLTTHTTSVLLALLNEMDHT